MRTAAPPVLTALLVVALGAGAGAHAQPRRAEVRLDAVLAVVGGNAPGPGVDSILLSDVELRARLALPPVVGPLPPLPGALLAATLDQLVAERLIEREARRLRAPPPSAVAVLAARRRLVGAAGGESAVQRLLATLGVGPAEVTEIATRRALVDAFLRGNLESTATITEGAVDDAVARLGRDDPGEPGAAREDEPEEERRERVRAELARRAIQRGVRRLVEALRSRTVVRMFRTPGRAAPAPRSATGGANPARRGQKLASSARGRAVEDPAVPPGPVPGSRSN